MMPLVLFVGKSLNGFLFSLGLMAAFAGSTIAVLALRGKLRLEMVFGEHTALGGVIIQILGAFMIALSQT